MIDSRCRRGLAQKMQLRLAWWRCCFRLSPQHQAENPEKLKSKRASSGSMVSKQIIQFKCVVVRCDQDFGTFCRERGLEKKKRFGEQPGATKPAADGLLETLVEVGSGSLTRLEAPGSVF